MKYLFLALTLFSLRGLAAENLSIDGTLFKKDQRWFLFVENEKAAFKKGTIELKDIPSAQKKFLIDKAYVQVTGEMDTCPSKKTCINVKSVKPTLFDPLAGRKK
jgi:hypothetical protein